MTTHKFLGLFLAFTIGALCVEIKSQREIATIERTHTTTQIELVREQGKLHVDVLGSYYDGIATCETTEHLNMATEASTARQIVTLPSK